MSGPTAAVPESVSEAWTRLTPGDGPIVLAVSGGPDSIALLHTAVATLPRKRLRVVTVDHRTRDDSADDAAFVARAAETFGVPCDIVTLERSLGPLSEEAARDLRLTAYADVAARQAATYVATGHHADDHVETLLFRILRGTGPAGLAGIPESRPLHAGSDVKLIRPLLAVGRDTLRRYLEANGVAFRLDPTNADAAFRRNRLRNEVLPLLREIMGDGVDDAVARLGQQASEYHAALERDVASIRAELAVADGTVESADTVVWPGGPLEKLDDLRVRILLVGLWTERGWPRRAMTREHWRAVAAVACGERPAVDLPGGISARNRRGAFELRRGPQSPPDASACVDSDPTPD